MDIPSNGCDVVKPLVRFYQLGGPCWDRAAGPEPGQEHNQLSGCDARPTLQIRLAVRTIEPMSSTFSFANFLVQVQHGRQLISAYLRGASGSTADSPVCQEGTT